MASRYRTPEELRSRFIADGRRIHGRRYDYSQVLYKGPGAKAKVTVICADHGPFLTDHQIHTTMGCGCPKCAVEIRRHQIQHSPQRLRKKFILEGRKIHGDYYDYSKVSYDGKHARDKVCIVCPVYGEFWQTYGNHVTLKHRHPSDKLNAQKHVFAGTLVERRDEFLRLARKMHRGIYQYPHIQDEYKNALSTITVVCSKCGTFTQSAHNHANGHGCTNCHRSKLERDLEHFLRRISPCIELILNDRKIIAPYELDFYLPIYKLAIEVGSYYHHSGDDKQYHARKQKMCAELGIDLMTLFDTDFIGNRRLVENMIKARMGQIKNKVAARKTVVEKIGVDEAKEFLERNHVQGFVSAKVMLGLCSENNELVALLTAGKPRFTDKYEWELLRYCTARGVSVQGGFSKLFAAFVRSHKPESVVSYANLRWGSGKMYEHAGFTLRGRTSPAAWYTGPNNGGKWLHRMRVQKHRLEKLLKNFNPELTAEKNLEAHHWKRVYDCGNNVYVWQTGSVK